MADNVFSPEDNPTDDLDTSNITLETLVGETQKYKTPDDLAKAYAHADAAIAAMKAEKIRLEAENRVLKELDQTRNKKPNDDSGNDDPPVNTPPEPKIEDKDLSTLVAEELKKSKEQDKFADNVNAVSDKLASFYGNAREAQKAVNTKAQELNVSVEWLMDVAGRSPVAFYNTLGIDQRSFNTPASAGDVNTAALNRDGNRKNFNYYEEIRKTDPKLYFSAPLRKEMFEQARQQGEKFYT